MAPQATFYFDLGSPFAYLTAERLERLEEPAPATWQPILLGGLFKLNGRSSWALSGASPRRAGMADIERRAAEYGLPPLRWPDPWPSDYLFAMRVATFAFQVGRGREFTRRAFRAAFQEGRDLSSSEQVLDAAAASGIDPQTAAGAAGDPAVKAALRTATDAAHERGVFGVPTVAVGEELFWGDDRLRDATARIAQSSAVGTAQSSVVGTQESATGGAGELKATPGAAEKG